MTRSYRHIEVQPIAGALGAEISGVDVSRPLDAEIISEIRQAWLEHAVIFLRDQRLTPQSMRSSFSMIAMVGMVGQILRRPTLPLSRVATGFRVDTRLLQP